MNYFYGPVLSRRLGFSLGVDIVPHKTCSFDCIYCQLGSERRRTLRRERWIDVAEFRRQLATIIKTKTVIDYITISGSGEPTLHKDLDKIITAIKTVTKKRYPVCVITNSSLLYRKKVRTELRNADLIIPSLDAARAATFHAVNKPHKDISFQKIIRGLMALRKEYRGKIWLEIMIVAGTNDRPEELQAFKAIIQKLKPDKVQLNLPLRPTPQAVAMPSAEQIKKIKAVFGSVCKVEIVHDIEPKRKRIVKNGDSSHTILRLLNVRPETFLRLRAVLGVNGQALRHALQGLLQKKQIVRHRRSGKTFYGIDDSRKRKKNSS